MDDLTIDFNVKSGVEKIWRWKIWILATGVLAGVLSIIYVLQLKDEFKSTSAFIPPDISSLNSMVFAGGVGYRGFEAAEEDDIDRTVDYLNSLQIKDSIARKFNLYDHYGIDREHPKADEWFYHRYSRKVSVSYSHNSVVQIEVYDTNPEIAAKIANTYLRFASDFFEKISMRKRGYAAALDRQEDIVEERERILDSLEYLRKEFKLYHLDDAGGDVNDILAEQIRTSPGFSDHYDEMTSLENQLLHLEARLGDLKSELDARALNIAQYPELIKITQEGEPMTFKARPKRSIIVILTVLAALFFASFTAMILDRRPA